MQYIQVTTIKNCTI